MSVSIVSVLLPSPISREQLILSILLYMREKGVVGGASIGFTRYHEKDETKIRGGEEFCKKIIGLDCNSMYLKCTAKEMATGWYSLREKKDNFKKQSRYSKESIQWLEHIAKERKIQIRHEMNSPLGEQRIGDYKVDGVCEETITIFEYHGCYHHGHCGTNFNPKKMGKDTGARASTSNIWL